MHDENGQMRMGPGWDVTKKHVDAIGRNMPYAKKIVNLSIDEQDDHIVSGTSTCSSTTNRSSHA